MTAEGLNITDGLLKGCDRQLTGRVVIPDGVRELRAGSFDGCRKMTEIVLPKTVERIGRGAFKDCTALKKADMKDAEIRQIPMGCFEGCLALGCVELPMAAKEIEESSFKGCYGLEKLSLTLNMTRIPDNAFRDCGRLSLIEIRTGGNKVSFGIDEPFSGRVYDDMKKYLLASDTRRDHSWSVKYSAGMGDKAVNYESGQSRAEDRELDRLRKLNEKLTAEKQKQSESIQELAAELDLTRQVYAEIRMELDAQRKKYEELLNANAKYKHDRDDFRIKESSYQGEIHSLRCDNEELLDRCANYEKKIEEYDNVYKACCEELDALNKNYDELLCTSAKYKHDRDEYKKKTGSCREELDVLKKKYEKERGRLAVKAEQLKSENERLVKENEKLKERLRKAAFGGVVTTFYELTEDELAEL